jgi:hypothetical protein
VGCEFVAAFDTEGKSVSVGFVILGMGVGTVAFGLSCAFGNSFLFSLLVYSASGSVSTLVFAMLSWIPARQDEKNHQAQQSLASTPVEH